MTKIAAVIPARSGSERVKDKNTKKLAGSPLIAIAAKKALEAQVFETVYPITDSKEYMKIFEEAGLQNFLLRPQETAQSDSPDFSWLSWWLSVVGATKYDAVAILRPTSPLRTVSTIQEGVEVFKDNWLRADSVRCVSSVVAHPGKMWIENDGVINPLIPFSYDGTPWHSNQTKVLPKVYAQNAMFEIVKTSSIHRSKTISGGVVVPIVKDGYEAIDVNQVSDLEYLEYLLMRYPELVDW